MERLIEQPVGEGDIYEGVTWLGQVHYHLSVYQNFSDIESESVPRHLSVEGRILSDHHVDLERLHHEQAEITLHLADGRHLDFRVVDGAGTVRSTGRGLRRPDEL